MNKQGRVTLPIQAGMDQEAQNILKRWGADAIRNSDGTELPESIRDWGVKVYSTYFPARGDHEWAREHPEETQQLYLSTPQVTSFEGRELRIDLLDGYFREQVQVDDYHDPKTWWEVRDRTSGTVVPADDWTYEKDSGSVTIQRTIPYHSYSVSFLSWQIWDSTQMYNHLTNDWGDKPHETPYDARQPKTREHMLVSLRNWLAEHPEVDVVRFTTFFYHFTNVFNDQAKEKLIDWFGYLSTVSPLAMEEFEKKYGYRLTPEDFVDQGYYNTPFRNPSRAFRDWIDFQQEFVTDLVRQMVDLTHTSGKEAIMFLGDNWIGTEPYGPWFAKTGLDAVVGSVGSGATLRMISDIPGVKYTEGRFLPYFFPDVFHEGGDPTGEAIDNWLQARRAILRKPVDRIGYGGYLSLAAEFPDFVDKVEEICEEFRTIYDRIGGTKPYTPTFKVAVLNSWGKLRSWQTAMVAHALWYKKIYSYVGVIEALSGLPVDVEFISFDDIKQNGIPSDIGVIINAGDAGTAWSGHDYWADEEIVTALKQFVYRGGGFIGIGEPSAYERSGRFFQLSDVLGVDKEIGYTLSYTKYDKENAGKHFIMEGQAGPVDCGEKIEFVRSVQPDTEVIQMQRGDIAVAAHAYGAGRSVYIAGLPYSAHNARLLHRAIFWSAGQEQELYRWHCDNLFTECAAYPETGWVCVINNSLEPQKTRLYADAETSVEVELAAGGHQWFRMEELAS